MPILNRQYSTSNQCSMLAAGFQLPMVCIKTDRFQVCKSFPSNLVHSLTGKEGVYFDIVLNDTSTVLVSLYNSGQQNSLETKRSASASLPFLLSINTSHAAPISLLVRVDDNEYVVLLNTSCIVSIREGNLDPLKQHSIRIIAPMVGGDIVETLQLEGIWIDQKGRLLPFDIYESDKNAQRDGLQLSPDTLTSPMQRKMLEIVTDMPGSLAGKDRRKSIGTTRSILSGVMGWEYLLGEMFGADHVMVGMEGMCLTEDCKGGRGSPAGLADVFFQRFEESSDCSCWTLTSCPLQWSCRIGAVQPVMAISTVYSRYYGRFSGYSMIKSCKLTGDADHEYWKFRLGVLSNL